MIETPSASRERTWRPGLSKSRIAIFEQCAKRLWLSVHKPEAERDSDNARRAFRIGHEIGALACALVPDGIMIDGSAGLAAAAAATRARLEAPEPRPLFEATFIHEGVAVRVDLMLPDGDGWHVVEVKSTTGVKPYQQADLATQLWVMRGCDVRVSRASICVIDTSFVLREEDNYQGLFRDEPAGDAVDEFVAGRGEIVAAANAVLKGSEPVIAVGAQCTNPFPCSFSDYCRRDLPPPPQWPIDLLPGPTGKAFARRQADLGKDDLTAVPSDQLTETLLQRVHRATITGIPYHDGEAIRRETAGWRYPRTFLDFESIAFAAPRWIGTSPYQQVPFQFSAHVDRGDGALEHDAFLLIDGSDPRMACARALAQLPSTGAVVAWNASFERRCLLDLAQSAPDHAAALRSLADRLVDLLPVVRRHYYHRDMRGSWSLKSVLPILAPELDYRTLDGARSGVEAQDMYLEAIDTATSHLRREQIRDGLLAYCARDTVAMVVVLERLCSAASDGTTGEHAAGGG